MNYRGTIELNCLASNSGANGQVVIYYSTYCSFRLMPMKSINTVSVTFELFSIITIQGASFGTTESQFRHRIKKCMFRHLV